MESMWFAYGFLFIFGTIIGSFLNAALFRFNTGRTLSGRSSCVSCGETLSPRDLVPLLSFLFLRGRCRSCKSRISPQYPLVEFAAGILATQCYRLFPDDALFFTLSFLSWMVLLFIMVYDMRHKIIPDFFSILLGAIVLCGI
ncbi:MAG TPA: prepilin peptidase, partial [Candidatus Paceibacterota bacterium]